MLETEVEGLKEWVKYAIKGFGVNTEIHKKGMDLLKGGE
jgi:hypothetical protein